MAANERWTSFLRQIAQRHEEVSRDAGECATAALAQAAFDPTPIGTAWGAIDMRLKDLERKIDDTWSAQVERTFEADGHDRGVIHAAREEGLRLRHELEDRRESLHHRIFADIARRLYARAVAERTDRGCPKCGAPLDVPITYRALQVRCAHCGALGTFEPGTLMRSVVAWGAHALSSEAAHGEWLAMLAAERAIRAVRPPCSLALLKAYERAQIAYWKAYVSARSQLEPEMRDVGLEVRSRMDAWYRYNAEHEPEWVRAGRPRELV
jgi:hypothetical protein